MILILFGTFVAYPWPMWTGMVFTDVAPRPWNYAYVEVPSYYEDADNWLSSQQGEFRIISLPLSPEDSTTLRWEHGYQGEEPSWSVFGRPTIALIPYRSISDALFAELEQFPLRSDQIAKVMAILNAKYIVVRNDIDYIQRNTIAPEVITQALRSVVLPTPDNGSAKIESRIVRVLNLSTTEDMVVPWAERIDKFELDPYDKINGSSSVVLSGNPTSINSLGFFYRVLEPDRRWPNATSLQFWLKTDVPSALFIQVYDTNEHQIGWDGRHDTRFTVTSTEVNTWKRFDLSLDEVDRSALNFDSISGIFFGLVGTQPNPPHLLKIANPILAEERAIGDSLTLLGGRALKGWEPVWYSKLTRFSLEKQDDKISVNLEATPTPSGELGLDYSVPVSREDWSDFRFLEFWLKTDVPAGLIVRVSDQSGNIIGWHGRSPSLTIDSSEAGTWKHFRLPLSSGGRIAGTAFDWKSIVKVRIGVVNSMQADQSTPPSLPSLLRVTDFLLDRGRTVKVRGVNFEISFGKLDFYRIDEEYSLGRIYATNQFLIAKDMHSFLYDVVSKTSFVPGNQVVFLLSQSGINNATQLRDLKTDYFYRPNVTFERYNPTSYRADIRNASKPFFLVFSESYHPRWKAYIDGQEVTQHFVGNGYANVWYIARTGSYTINIEFSTQRVRDYGIIASVASFLIVGTLLAKHATKLRRSGAAGKQSKVGEI